MRVLEAGPEDGEILSLLRQVNQEPLLIRHDDRDAAVVISPGLFKRMRVEDDFDAICEQLAAQAKATGLTEEKLAEILAEMDAER